MGRGSPYLLRLGRSSLFARSVLKEILPQGWFRSHNSTFVITLFKTVITKISALAKMMRITSLRTGRYKGQVKASGAFAGTIGKTTIAKIVSKLIPYRIRGFTSWKGGQGSFPVAPGVPCDPLNSMISRLSACPQAFWIYPTEPLRLSKSIAGSWA